MCIHRIIKKKKSLLCKLDKQILIDCLKEQSNFDKRNFLTGSLFRNFDSSVKCSEHLTSFSNQRYIMEFLFWLQLHVMHLLKNRKYQVLEKCHPFFNILIHIIFSHLILIPINSFYGRS